MAVSQRTLLDVVRLSTGYLAQHGSQSPRLDAELLAAHALQLRRIDLYLQHERPLSESELAAVRDLVRRRASGEPVAYLTGEREFFGRTFIVTADVLVPRPETEVLVQHALRIAATLPDPVRIADVGTGSGAIAVTLAAELHGTIVDAVDCSEPALDVARHNAERHSVAGTVVLHHGSWAEPLQAVYDIIVSNPPYVTTAELAAAQPDVRDHEPRLALDSGADGLTAYRTLLATLPGRLAAHGALLLEVDPRRAAAVRDLVVAALSPASTAIHLDLAGHQRVVEALMP